MVNQNLGLVNGVSSVLVTGVKWLTTKIILIGEIAAHICQKVVICSADFSDASDSFACINLGQGNIWKYADFFEVNPPGGTF